MGRILVTAMIAMLVAGLCGISVPAVAVAAECASGRQVQHYQRHWAQHFPHRVTIGIHESLCPYLLACRQGRATKADTFGIDRASARHADRALAGVLMNMGYNARVLSDRDMTMPFMMDMMHHQAFTCIAVTGW